ncbi:MAG TPA: phospholipase D-like domain-containing protein [Candidatus Saccharimonadales bacterium]|nr:phospholipase D-like domain-containing protein [Candidatus Saccharimonadales bacterium]
MFGLRKLQGSDNLLSSSLLDQNSFYCAFEKDLAYAKHEVIVESPFMSFKRLNHLLPIFRKLVRRKVRVVINTKPPEEQDAEYVWQAEECIALLQELGVEVLITGGHHRKLAIIDRQILYEGSLNILSQNDSCEVMRRIYSEQLAVQMINFIGISKFIG